MADNNFSHIVNNNVFHLLHLMSEHQQMTFNVQAVIKIESWHRERESQGFGQEYLNFATIFFKNISLIPETSAYFYRLFETSSTLCVTASKQTVQNIVMVTVEFSPDNTE